MNVVIVGAGAIGLSWGWHFQRGGADVTFLVRARYVEDLRAGVPVLPHGRRTVERFDRFVAASDVSCAAEADLIVLAMPSTGLDPAQLDALHRAAPASAVILSLLPQPDDHERVAAAMPGRTVLVGMLAIVAWWSPLPGLEGPEAHAWWFPPLASCDIGGDDEAAARVVAVLRRGGLPTRVKRGTRPRSDLPNALLLCLVAGLAISGWTFAGMRSSSERRTVQHAARETMALVRRRTGSALPAFVAASGFSSLGLLALELGSRLIVPVPFAPFLRVHFTKVAPQMSANLRAWITEARAAGLPCEALATISAGYDAAVGIASDVTPSR